MPRKLEVDLEKLKQFHTEGLTDREIGEKLGASAATIRLRRNKLGLAAHRIGRPPSKGGNPASPATRSKIASAGGDFHRARKATLSSAPGAGRVTIQMDEDTLDCLWAKFDIEVKGKLISKVAEV